MRETTRKIAVYSVVLVAVSALTGCGTPVFEPTDASETALACHEFYQAVSHGHETEAVYTRRLANHIEELDHPEAAQVLSDLASAWESGTVGPEDMVELAPDYARAGQLLADDGEPRCQDLAEALGVDGFEGQADQTDLSERQSQIWAGNGIDDYYLLVADLESDAGDQYQVRVRDGQPEAVVDVVAGVAVDADSAGVPVTVEGIYDDVAANGFDVIEYDLVHAVPLFYGPYIVKFQLDDYPDPVIFFGD
ncbi:MAG: hypothetical protein WAL25_07255 [Acidimicrobiia bacterium]